MTYGKLVNNLRICSRCDFGQNCNGCTQDSDDAFCCDKLLHEAADAIEKLDDICQHQADEIRELKKKLQKSEANIGKWIVDRAFGNDVMSNEQMVICSVCHKGTFYGKQNFCPNCGTKMELEDDN